MRARDHISSLSSHCIDYFAFTDHNNYSTHDHTSTTATADPYMEYYYPWKVIHSDFHERLLPHEMDSLLNPQSNNRAISYANRCLMSAKKYRILGYRLLRMYEQERNTSWSYVMWVDSSRYLTNIWLYEDMIQVFKDSEARMVFYQHPFAFTVEDEVAEAWKQPRYRENGGVVAQYNSYKYVLLIICLLSLFVAIANIVIMDLSMNFLLTT